MKFEAYTPANVSHATQATYPLYAGRRYHLAATMKTWSTRTNLSLFVNGQLLAWKNETSYQVKSTGTAALYLGQDQATAGAYFKGIADEFRLDKTALTQDSIKGMLWFLKGANNVLIPRGVFYDSKFYGSLNGSFSASSPFAGGTAYGNTNTLSSNLNSRVIQIVITKNLTLAQAWGILDLARTQNGTTNVTAFPFFATSEFYTIGLSWEVSKLAANTSVVNGGNVSTAPPPTAWQLFWNTVAGWAERVWNAVVAVGAFFENVGKWLVQAALAYVKGLTTGNWTDFKNQVLKPLEDAFNALVNFILDLVRVMLKPISDLVVAAFRRLMAPVAGAMTMVSNELNRANPSMEYHASVAAWVLMMLLLNIVILAFLPIAVIAEMVDQTTRGAVVALAISVLLISLLAGAIAFAALDLLDFEHLNDPGYRDDRLLDPTYGLSALVEELPDTAWEGVKTARMVLAFYTTVVLVVTASKHLTLFGGVGLILASAGLVLFAYSMTLGRSTDASWIAGLGIVLSLAGILNALANIYVLGLKRPLSTAAGILVSLFSIWIGLMTLDRIR